MAHKNQEERMCAVSEDTLFYAFRYALGRKTYAVPQVAEEIRMNVGNITRSVAETMVNELDAANAIKPLEDCWLQVKTLMEKKIGKR